MGGENEKLPGNGFFGWLGRQVGHVTKAVKTEVEGPEDPSKIIYRECTIEEQVSPADPNVRLRRTIIDEVVQERQKAEGEAQHEEKKTP